jgi:hypothetical protein
VGDLAFRGGGADAAAASRGRHHNYRSSGRYWPSKQLVSVRRLRVITCMIGMLEIQCHCDVVNAIVLLKFVFFGRNYS